LKGLRGRGTAATDKPPIFGMIQRGGQVVLRVLDNVRQATIKPIIQQFIKPGTLINTDE
jgi:transposase-like protein